ncbi:MAG: hypothetical protein PSY14_08185 [bacterium]|nr:hypothetical protein [bacterium]
MNYRSALLLLAVTCAAPLAATAVNAQTVETKSVTQQMPYSAGKVINLANFDLNKNGMLSSFEVSEMLFKLFDTDTSGAIDNAEYDNKSVLTVAPMEKLTTLTYDYDNDGTADKTQYTFETFTKDTQLARFDLNKDGLSPAEFIGKPLAEIDTDKNGRIELMEWRGAYMSKIAMVLTK